MEAIISYLKEAYHPLSMILYGSYGDGTNTRNSDFDALLLIQEGPEHHDISVIDGVLLDVFVYPISEIQKKCDYSEFLQIMDGRLLFDTDGLGRDLMEKTVRFVNSQPGKSLREIREELVWCRKMLLRIQREDPEGLFRWHWLLVDSLEIACDVLGHPYRGPKKSIEWMRKVHPDLFQLYHRALAEMDTNAVESWIACLEAHVS